MKFTKKKFFLKGLGLITEAKDYGVLYQLRRYKVDIVRRN